MTCSSYCRVDKLLLGIELGSSYSLKFVRRHMSMAEFNFKHLAPFFLIRYAINFTTDFTSKSLTHLFSQSILFILLKVLCSNKKRLKGETVFIDEHNKLYIPSSYYSCLQFFQNVKWHLISDVSFNQTSKAQNQRLWKVKKTF